MSFSKAELEICEQALALKHNNDEGYKRFISKLSYGALLRLEAIMTKYENTLED